MGKLIVYGLLGSPAVRTVVLTLHALGLDYDFIEVDPRKGETKSEEFLKKNPQQTIPLLEDNGHYITDSHSIAAYLVRKYGKNDLLYPKDFNQRAVVDQRLHFDTGVLFTRTMKGFTSPHLTKEEKVANLKESYNFLEAFLEGEYIAGDHLTIADLSVLATTSTLNEFIAIDVAKTPKLIAWLELMKKLPYYDEVNAKGLEVVRESVKPILDAAGL